MVFAAVDSAQSRRLDVDARHAERLEREEFAHERLPQVAIERTVGVDDVPKDVHRNRAYPRDLTFQVSQRLPTLGSPACREYWADAMQKGIPVPAIEVVRH